MVFSVQHGIMIFGLKKLPSGEASGFNNLREQNGNNVGDGPINKFTSTFVGIFESCIREQAEVSSETGRRPSHQVTGDRVTTPSTSPLTSVCLSNQEGIIDHGHFDGSDPDTKIARSSKKTSDIDIDRVGNHLNKETMPDWDTDIVNRAVSFAPSNRFPDNLYVIQFADPTAASPD